MTIKLLGILSIYFVIDVSLDEFLRRRAKLVRVTDQVNEKILRGFFQTLFWRRRFLAQSSSSSSRSLNGVGKYINVVMSNSSASNCCGRNGSFSTSYSIGTTHAVFGFDTNAV